MNARVVDKIDDGVIAQLVLVAQVLCQVHNQLPAYGLIAVHVTNVLELRLTWGERHTPHTQTHVRHDTLYTNVFSLF